MRVPHVLRNVRTGQYISHNGYYYTQTTPDLDNARVFRGAGPAKLSAKYGGALKSEWEPVPVRLELAQPKAVGSTPVSLGHPAYHTEIDRVVAFRQAEERMLRVCDQLAENPSVDRRWLAIGRTHLEQASMALNRSVFRPRRLKLPEDAE